MRREAKNSRWRPAKAGDKVGRWLLVEYVGTDRLGQRWRVRCECGRVEAVRSLPNLRSTLKQRGMAQCRWCGAEHRDATGGARRSGLASMAARHGDRAAFALMGGAWGAEEEDLP